MTAHDTFAGIRPGQVVAAGDPARRAQDWAHRESARVSGHGEGGRGRTDHETHRGTTAALGAAGLDARLDRRARRLGRRVRYGADDADESAPVLRGPLRL